MKPPEFRHGVYRHFKGDLYKTLVLALHHAKGLSEEIWMVVYVSLSDGKTNTRELREWIEAVNEESRTGSLARQRDRFEWLSD